MADLSQTVFVRYINEAFKRTITHTHTHTHTNTLHTHTHTHIQTHTHTHGHTPMNGIGRNAMRCISLKNKAIY